MRNRWFHEPKLHTGLQHEKKVTWLELFFDLIFVAAIIQLGDALSSEVASTHHAIGPFVRFCALFTPLWVAWTGFTFFANRFDVDDFLHRGFVFLLMGSMGAVAIAAPGAFEGTSKPFALAVSSSFALVSLMHVRALKHGGDARDYCVYWATVFAIAAGLWVVSAFVPNPVNYAFWVLGTLAVLVSPISARSRGLSERYPIDMEHLAERYGLLTIIVLGESFVKVLTYLTEGGYASSLYGLSKGGGVLLVTCCVWWIYFDDVAGSEIKERKESRGGWIMWLYGHLPLAFGMTAVGVALKKAVSFDLAEPAPDEYRALLTLALVTTFVAVAMLDSITERREAQLSDHARVNIRLGSAALLAVIGGAGDRMSAMTYLGLVGIICAGQVLFDMMSAPFDDSEFEGTMKSSEHARETLSKSRSGEVRERKSTNFEEFVRQGAPAELRNDLYFFFMHGSWVRLLLTLVVAFGLLNAFFAGLFLLDPQSVSMEELDFAGAFFFSVQTMSTIGYGGLSPASTYGDVVVTVEAAVGLLGVALATGLIFAKVSRPQSSTLFSRPIVVRQFEGQPTLSFRVGNARGNEVVSASITVSALIESFSVEGEHLRRLVDLKLVRNTNPVFRLSWTVSHVIDEESPLFGLDLASEDTPIMAFIVSMVGYDATYGQQTHARHLYEPGDVRVGHRFADVIHQLPDGRLMIDYHQFHDIELEDPGGSVAGMEGEASGDGGSEPSGPANDSDEAQGGPETD